MALGLFCWRSTWWNGIKCVCMIVSFSAAYKMPFPVTNVEARLYRCIIICPLRTSVYPPSILTIWRIYNHKHATRRLNSLSAYEEMTAAEMDTWDGPMKAGVGITSEQLIRQWTCTYPLPFHLQVEWAKSGESQEAKVNTHMHACRQTHTQLGVSMAD
jgi:hypothetical protein